MKSRALCCLLFVAASCLSTQADVVVDAKAFGESLGGWKARKGDAAEYEISGSKYRTYQPEVTPSPDDGIFVSLRVDHVRGFFASDDYASLELSFAADGTLVSAQSSLALQGRTITSELIKGGAAASTTVAAPGINSAVKVGTDLVADLSSKLLREKIVEPGRVSFPAAIRHNYNLLYRTVKFVAAKPEKETIGNSVTPAPETPALTPAGPNAPVPPPPAPPAKSAPEAPAAPAPGTAAPADPKTTATGKKEVPLPEIKPWNGNNGVQTPLPAEKEKEKSTLVKLGEDALKVAKEVAKDQLK